jgi:hypothetical protein
MRIVLPGALPNPPQARELTPHLERSAPTLVRWFAGARAHRQAADPAASGCTAYEYWQLMQHGFTPRAGQNFATGLGPLYGQSRHDSDKPVWLAELVHVSPARDGAALLPAAELAIDPQHSVALFESVHAMALESGFTLHHTSTERWQIQLPAGCEPATVASPAIVSRTSVNDWWHQDAASRPWRRLVNEIQMLWFDHPVNQQRYSQGQVPLNSLWLYGGAQPDQMAGPAAQEDTRIIDDLQEAAMRQDWGLWLQQLEQLEQTVFKPLANQAAPALVLTGEDQVITLTPRTGLLARLTPNRTNWRSWWSPQN